MCTQSLVSLSLYRYVIYPIQVLAKSCKPVPVMLMGAAMGKVYPARKYANVVMIVLGVALFMGAGTDKKKSHSSASDGDDDDSDSSGSPSQIIGIVLLFVSLCFDGGTGAYEDKLMSVHSVQPFDLMYNIQLGKTILAFIGLLVLNQLHIFIQMVQEMGFLLVALGLSGALGQVFIFVTIAKFGALTCSIIGLARKVTTLVASIYFYGHHLNSLQFTGLMISVTAMVLNFLGKKGGGGHGDGHGAQPTTQNMPEEMQKMLDDEPHDDDDDDDDDDSGGDVELAASPKELV
jgi:UDP-galactose transporter B1